jgi:hypothetical protein
VFITILTRMVLMKKASITFSLFIIIKLCTVSALCSTGPIDDGLVQNNSTKSLSLSVARVAPRLNNEIIVARVASCVTDITVARINELARMHPNVVSLNFTGCGEMTDETLSRWLIEFPKLECLNLPANEMMESTFHSITDAAIVTLAEHCKKLRRVNLSYASITDAAVTALAENCKEMQALKLNSDNLTEDAIVFLVQQCKELQELDLAYCWNITNKTVFFLAKNCKKLRTVDLSGCDNVTDIAILILAENCKKLRSMKLECCTKITYGILDDLEKNYLKLVVMA